MALNRNDFIFDDFHTPSFNPNLAETVRVTSGETYLNAPSNLDVIEIELINELDQTVDRFRGHINTISGIKYEANLLHVDTFSLVAQLFGRTEGVFSLKISGYRDYIYNTLSGDGTDPIETEDGNIQPEGDVLEIEDINPSQVEFSKLEIIEVSKTGTEIRLKSDAKNAIAFDKFHKTEYPGSLPIDGFYWKYGSDDADDPTKNDYPTVYFAKFSEGYNETANLAFSSPQQYSEHRIERGLPGVDENGNFIFTGIRIVDRNFEIVGYSNNEPNAISEEDIWPVYIRATKPTSGDTLNLVGLNWMYHEYTPKPNTATPNEQPDPIDTIIVKLASPVPPSFKAGVKVSLTRPLFVPFTFTVDINIPFLIDETFSELRGPNLRIGTRKNAAKGTLVKNEQDIVGTNADIKNRLESKVISGSEYIECNFDFSEYKNFVHFSSATERLKNFKYKVGSNKRKDDKPAEIKILRKLLQMITKTSLQKEMILNIIKRKKMIMKKR